MEYTWMLRKEKISIEEKRRAWFGLLIGDAYGAGWETKSCHYIKNNEDQLDAGYKQRDVGYREMNKPGDYTDDTAMTIGVAQALFVTQNNLTSMALAESWNRIYSSDCKRNEMSGPRFGWGSWRKVATSFMEEKDWITTWITTCGDQSKRKEPTNGCNMRQLPIILKYMDRSFNNVVVLIENIYTQVITTHPNAIALISCIAQALATICIITKQCPEKISVLAYVSKYMKNELGNCISSFKEYFDNNVLIDTIETFVKKLDEIDQLPEINTSICSDISWENPRILWDTICFEGASGLAVSSSQTAYAALYFLKWSHNTSIYNNLKRVVSFGGDTDTLAAIVMPVVMMTQELDTPIDQLFPTWVMEGLEIPDSLEALVYL
jgi:ADP-ribosylglycohydrolase